MLINTKEKIFLSDLRYTKYFMEKTASTEETIFMQQMSSEQLMCFLLHKCFNSVIL